MPLSKQYVRSEIEVKPAYVILRVYYSWYWISEIVDTFTFSTLQEAKDHLLRLRSYDHLEITESKK